jgi:Glycosyl transferase family 2
MYLYRSIDEPDLVVVDKASAGCKADASNAGINAASGDVLLLNDADTMLEPDALSRGALPFLEDPNNVAAGGYVAIANGSRIEGGRVIDAGMPPRWLARFQIVEYMRSFLLFRLACASQNAVTIVSGAFGVFRRACSPMASCRRSTCSTRHPRSSSTTRKARPAARKPPSTTRMTSRSVVRSTNLPALREIGFAANRRLLRVEYLSHDCLIGDDHLDAVAQPIIVGTQRAAGLRFGDRRVLALMHALSLFALNPTGFRHRDIRTHIAQLRGRIVDEYAAAQATYDLRRLRLHGLIERAPHSHKYRITSLGARVAILHVRIYARAMRPAASLPTSAGSRRGPQPLSASMPRSPPSFRRPNLSPEKPDSTTYNSRAQDSQVAPAIATSRARAGRVEPRARGRSAPWWSPG